MNDKSRPKAAPETPAKASTTTVPTSIDAALQSAIPAVRGSITVKLNKLCALGDVSYGWITDGTRLVRKPETWSDLDRMLSDAASSYRRALWGDQSVEAIILSEKDAISGAILTITVHLDVELGITRGYSSVTSTMSGAR